MQVFKDIAKKKEELVEAIIIEEYNQYYRLAYSYVHNDADACDIVQNGAYKALRNSHTLKKQEYAKSWVYRIMLNEIFTYVKQPQVESYEKALAQNMVVEEGMEDQYSDIDLQEALDLLSGQEKAIVIMKYFEEKKLEEIAEILDENVNTIKSKLYRSLRKLRIQLAEED